MKKPSVEVTIFDTTLRDGAQALPSDHQFPDGSRAEIAHHIAALGAGVIEAGFPETPGDEREVANVAATVGQTAYNVSVWQDGEPAGQIQRIPVITGLSRAVLGDIETTWRAVQSAQRARIHTVIPTDNDHMRKKLLSKSPQQVFRMGSDAVKLAKQLTAGHPDATVEFSAEAASTTDYDYLERVVKEALAQGADIINVPDTVGERSPMWMLQFYGRVIDWVMSNNPNATISAHNHDDLGQAVANTNMLAYAAAEYAHAHNKTVKIQAETTITGIGERAGNADMFPVVAGLFNFSPDMAVPVQWQFNPERSVEAANTIMGYANLEVPRQSPVIGSDINKHRSGIHSDGVIKGGHRLYTPFDPTFWGHKADAVHEDGKYQGRRARKVIGT